MIGPALRRPFAGRAKPTTSEVVGGFTADPTLKAVLTAQWGDYGLPPHLGSFAIHALVVDHYLDGASYPVGGAAQLVASIAPTISARGGQIVVRAEVAEVTINSHGRAGGVRLTDGRELRSEIVISDAGAALTLGPLLPSGMPTTTAWRADAAAIGPSTAYACLYLGLDATDAELGLTGTNMWVYPDSDSESRWDDMVHRGRRQPIGAYISFPSAKDPTYQARRPGRATIEAITFVPFEWFRPWLDSDWHKRGPEYEAVKAELEDWLLAAVQSRLPSIRGHIVHAELSTPLSNRHFTAAPEGEAYGLAHTPRRFMTHSFGPATPVPGLYLTGQDVFACGLAGSAMGGVLAASVILRRNLVGKMMAS
jgi:all-trans-retinol 13,14-reductase